MIGINTAIFSPSGGSIGIGFAIPAAEAVHVIEDLVRAHDPLPLHQKKQLLRNLGNGRFEEMTAAAGPAFALSEVGRGLAVGDLDNDGGIDSTWRAASPASRPASRPR